MHKQVATEKEPNENIFTRDLETAAGSPYLILFTPHILVIRNSSNSTTSMGNYIEQSASTKFLTRAPELIFILYRNRFTSCSNFLFS